MWTNIEYLAQSRQRLRLNFEHISAWHTIKSFWIFKMRHHILLFIISIIFDMHKRSQNLLLISACIGLEFVMFVHNSIVDKWLTAPAAVFGTNPFWGTESLSKFLHTSLKQILSFYHKGYSVFTIILNFWGILQLLAISRKYKKSNPTFFI